ncbi:MAG: DUF5715 family protein [Gemmatimonadaceae bacterium]
MRPVHRLRFPRLGRAATLAIGVALSIGATPWIAAAQRRSRLPEALRGSQASVQKMHDFAESHHLPFYLTPTNVSDAVKTGRLVTLTGDSTYELTSGVGFSYATREARQFVLDFAPQYFAACGTPLTVTSAARPISRQPRNSNPYSVHPTGIAVDLRRPNAGPCQTWLRNALAELEARGFVEATEERHPPHLHVAVLTEPGRVVSLPQLASGAIAATPPDQAVRVSNTPVAGQRIKVPSSNAASGDAIRGSTYRVREGDTLWDVARRSGVSVSELARANKRSPRGVLRPGVTLRLPPSNSR